MMKRRYRRRLNPKIVELIKYVAVIGGLLVYAWLFVALFC